MVRDTGFEPISDAWQAPIINQVILIPQKMARRLGFEPRLLVLETNVLYPLNTIGV